MASDERILSPKNYPFGLKLGMTMGEVRYILEGAKKEFKEDSGTITVPDMHNRADNQYYVLVCKFRFYGTPNNLYEICYR